MSRAKRGVAAGRSAQRGTSGATTGGGGRSAPDPDKSFLCLVLNADVGVRQVDPRPARELAETGTNGKVGWHLHQFDVDPHRVVAVVHQVLPQLLGLGVVELG